MAQPVSLVTTDDLPLGTTGNPLPVKGIILTPSSSITRPADTTAYASGDLVANSTTAGSVVPLSWTVGGAGMIRRVRMYSDDGDVTNASFRLHLFTSAPTVSNGDNGALAAVISPASYLGAVDITLDRTVVNGDATGAGVPFTGAEMNFPETATLYGLLEARAAYTPASAEVLTLIPEIHVY